MGVTHYLSQTAQFQVTTNYVVPLYQYCLITRFDHLSYCADAFATHFQFVRLNQFYHVLEVHMSLLVALACLAEQSNGQSVC